MTYRADMIRVCHSRQTDLGISGEIGHRLCDVLFNYFSCVHLIRLLFIQQFNTKCFQITGKASARNLLSQLYGWSESQSCPSDAYADMMKESQWRIHKEMSKPKANPSIWPVESIHTHIHAKADSTRTNQTSIQELDLPESAFVDLGSFNNRFQR